MRVPSDCRPLSVSCVVLMVVICGDRDANAEGRALPYHDIQVHLIPSDRHLQILDTLTVTGREIVTFRLADWLSMDRVVIAGQSVTAERRKDKWVISLPDRARNSIKISASGVVPALPKGNKSTPFASAMADRDGSYLPGFSAWLPDTGDNWINYKINVRVPADQRAVTSGRLLTQSKSETSYSATFVADYPARLPSLFAGPYETAEREIDGIQYQTYFHSAVSGFSNAYISTSAAFVQRYAKAIGAYPYGRFNIISSPLPVGLGFANLTYIGKRIVPLPFMRGRSLAHEVLHNWWGNGVGIDYSTGNWAEGLTTYMADHALAADRDPELASEMRQGWLRDFSALPIEQDFPVRLFRAKGHLAGQVVGYNKVAFIFHMLRDFLGPTTFQASLQRFWQDNKFSIAGWADLEKAFTATAQQDLSWFFQQWLEWRGAPEIQVPTVQSVKTDSGYQVSISISQSAPYYRMRVPVVVQTQSGKLHTSIDLEGATSNHVIELTDLPTALTLDPEFDVFRRLLSGETAPILRDVALASNPTLHILRDAVDYQKHARTLANAILEADPHVVVGALSQTIVGPAVIVGGSSEVERALQYLGLNTVADVDGKGTSAAWAAETPGGVSVYIIRADTEEQLKNITRPLPHYGKRSYVVFEGSKATDKGIWKVNASPLTVRLDP